MDQLWKQTYFNRRNWLLENIKNLSCTLNEVVVLLMIDFMNEFNIKITPQSLGEYCNLKETEIDQIVTSLTSKAYLKLHVTKSGVEFIIDEVFSLPKKEEFEIQELFSLFEEEFGRPLSQKEYVFLNNWKKKYARKLIVDALREASVLQKYSFDYIDRILIRMKKDEDND